MSTSKNPVQSPNEGAPGEELAREVCLCFHVSLSKLVNFARRNRPKVVAQMSECHGAGSGCGWCRPELARIMHAIAADPDVIPALSASRREYEEGRRAYGQQSGANSIVIAGEEPLADALE